nr:MarR family winged helix-turn-helix transcriptional regulator [Microbacterium bovistercoris]
MSRTTTQERVGAERLWDTTVGGDVAFLLARANALSLSRTSEALSAHALKVRSYSVLGVVVSDARPTQRELSDFLELDPSQIVALVDGLERQGFVRRESDPGDRRANVVVATPEGRAAFVAARASAQAAEERTLGALSAREREQLADLIRRLAVDDED